MMATITEFSQHTTDTPDGKNWLTMALDPFHDTNVPVTGYPDQLSTATAVQYVKKNVTIVKPTNLAPGLKWDCHIATLPIADTVFGFANSQPNERGHYEKTGGAATPVTMGTVTVVKGISGYGSFPNDVGGFAYQATRQTYGYSGTDDNRKSPSRLIGGGFEVHNDTAELEKQGSVTVYSMTNAVNGSAFCGIFDMIPVANHIAVATVRTARMPPATRTAAASLNDARTWQAAEGCYVPFRLNTESDGLRMSPRENGAFAFTSNDSGDGDAVSNFMITNTNEEGFNDNVPNVNFLRVVHGASTNVNGSELALDTLPGCSGYRVAPIHTSGAYFSGLSEATVLTLSLRFVLEVAPTTANPALLYMTSPSPLYDAKALTCYANCVNRLPPGVPVDQNAKGDFWRLVKTVGKNVAKTMLPFAPPVVQVAAQGVKNVAKEVKKTRKQNLQIVPTGRVTRPANTERKR